MNMMPLMDNMTPFMGPFSCGQRCYFWTHASARSGAIYGGCRCPISAANASIYGGSTDLFGSRRRAKSKTLARSSPDPRGMTGISLRICSYAAANGLRGRYGTEGGGCC